MKEVDSKTLRLILDVLNSQDIKLNIRPYYPAGNILGIILGGVFCVSGIFLVLIGLNGSIEWLLKAGSLSSRLTNASPGVIICLMGMIIVWRYKPRLKYKIKITPSSVEISSEKMKIVGPKITSEGKSSSPIKLSPPRTGRLPFP